MRSQVELAAFLHYGFLPRLPENLGERAWARESAHAVRDLSDAEAIERGVAALREACSFDGARHIVPLSGGLDSRLILGLLLEAGQRERIQAVTFGTRGSLDFEIGREVAQSAGVAHVSLDFNEVALDHELLLDTARAGASWTPLFEAYYNHLLPLRFGTDCVYWSGIMANTLNGSNLSARGETWEVARARFAARTVFSRSVALTPDGFSAESVLPDRPLLAESNLEPFEQLHLAFRYGCRYEPSLIRPGFEFRTPFREAPWVRFVTSLTRQQREGQRLYRELCRTAYPRLFSIRTKSNQGAPLGAKRWRVQLARLSHKLNRMAWERGIARRNPGLNYVDFERAIRKNGHLRELVRFELDNLEQRSCVDWIDIRGLWREHDAGQRNHGAALTLLASLEISLQADSCAAVPQIKHGIGVNR